MSAPLLAAKLIELRREHGLCQQDVADYLGMTREGYSHYERNTREPNLEILLKLCQFYTIDISQLVNTTLVPVSSIDNNSSLPLMEQESATASPVLIKNLEHMLKLLSGKYATLDITNITKDDLELLMIYKQLTKSAQTEIMDYIRFKYQNSKEKER